MTLARIISLISFCSLMLVSVSGQQNDTAVITEKMDALNRLNASSMAPAAPGDALEIPNVFTPNGDQVNDFFQVETDGTTVYEFSVFTRTGTRVYYSRSPRINWDGKSLEGKDLREGIYYYVIEEAGGTNPFESAGFFYLFR